MSAKTKFQELLGQEYPHLKADLNRIPDTLFSDSVLPIPGEYLTEARMLVEIFHKARISPFYPRAIRAAEKHFTQFNPGNFSLFMCFDFHITARGLKLIEINTQAAGGPLTWYLSQIQETNTAKELSDYPKRLKESFEKEWQLFGQSGKPNLSVILDVHPETQFSYIEFLILKEWMTSWGWETEIVTPDSLKPGPDQTILTEDGRRIDFVCNRWTNFLLLNHEILKSAFLNKGVCLSPNPHDYLLLADKGRLIELADPSLHQALGLNWEESEFLQKTLPDSFILDRENMDLAWKTRKKYFFKPSRSFASKAGYRGASITRKMFNNAVTENYIAQEYIPPTTIRVGGPTPEKEKDFKYDLRFFTYQNQVQWACGRLFSGQLMNFREPGSGFSAIQWTSATSEPIKL